MERIYKEGEVPSVALDIVRMLEDRSAKNNNATLIVLSGDLGAGKTTLVQEIARVFGVKESVISPTYVIMKKYKIDNSMLADVSQVPVSFSDLIHIDAYRIENEEELLRIGWQSIISNPSNLVCVEWPEKVPKLTEKFDFSITLSHHDNHSRKVTIVRYTDK